MELNILGECVEIAGFVMLSIPIISMIVAANNIRLLAKARNIPREITDEICRAEIINAIWPDNREKCILVAGFIMHLSGMVMMLVSELAIR